MSESYYAIEKFAEAERSFASIIEAMPIKRKAIDIYREKNNVQRAKDTFSELENIKRKLLDTVRETGLLFSECDIPDCSEYANKLYGAVKSFNLLTPDYTKLISAVTVLKNRIPKTETVDATLIGRLMNNVKMGYYEFLSLLRLNRNHLMNLENRGLNFGHIHKFMYRSIPTDNVFRREVLEALASKYNLVGIPGFWYDDKGNLQLYCKKIGGIFIPVCDKDGYIQGLQMRLDVPPDSDEKKFRWFSSKHFNGGTGARSWVHVVGDTTAKEACLTEGAMKADITSVLSDGKLFIAVPGVNAIEYLPNTLRELGITKVYEAFDMDKRSKPEVKQALITLRNTLSNMGVECVSCTWNPKYKGMDDYILAKTMSMQQISLAA